MHRDLLLFKFGYFLFQFSDLGVELVFKLNRDFVNMHIDVVDFFRGITYYFLGMHCHDYHLRLSGGSLILPERD